MSSDHDMVFCMDCGIERQGNERLCTYCGGLFDEPDETGVAPDSPAPGEAPAGECHLQRLPPVNVEKRVAAGMLFLAIAALCYFIAPHTTNKDVSLIVLIACSVGALTFFIRASALDRILSGAERCAWWSYSEKEWNEFAEEEYTGERAKLVVLCLAIAVAALLFGICSLPASHSAQDRMTGYGAVILGILLVVTALVTWIKPYKRDDKYLHEALFSLDGVYVKRTFHTWGGFFNPLKSVVMKGSYIEITYEQVVFYGHFLHPIKIDRSVRIPIPTGEDDTAWRLVRDISTRHRIGTDSFE